MPPQSGAEPGLNHSNFSPLARDTRTHVHSQGVGRQTGSGRGGPECSFGDVAFKMPGRGAQG